MVLHDGGDGAAGLRDLGGSRIREGRKYIVGHDRSRPYVCVKGKFVFTRAQRTVTRT